MDWYFPEVIQCRFFNFDKKFAFGQKLVLTFDNLMICSCTCTFTICEHWQRKADAKSTTFYSSDLYISTVKCNFQTYDDNIGPKLKKQGVVLHATNQTLSIYHFLPFFILELLEHIFEHINPPFLGPILGDW